MLVKSKCLSLNGQNFLFFHTHSQRSSLTNTYWRFREIESAVRTLFVQFSSTFPGFSAQLGEAASEFRRCKHPSRRSKCSGHNFVNFWSFYVSRHGDAIFLKRVLQTFCENWFGGKIWLLSDWHVPSALKSSASSFLFGQLYIILLMSVLRSPARYWVPGLYFRRRHSSTLWGILWVIGSSTSPHSRCGTVKENCGLGRCVTAWKRHLELLYIWRGPSFFNGESRHGSGELENLRRGLSLRLVRRSYLLHLSVIEVLDWSEFFKTPSNLCLASLEKSPQNKQFRGSDLNVSYIQELFLIPILNAFYVLWFHGPILTVNGSSWWLINI